MTNKGEEVARVVVVMNSILILAGLLVGYFLIPTDWGMFIGIAFGAVLGFSVSFGYQKFKLTGGGNQPEEAMRF